MYRLLRNTHLLLGLFFFTFVLMFGVSSVRFSHRDWFPANAIESQTVLDVPSATPWEPRTLAADLMQSNGLRGGLQQIRDTADGFRFNITRIGTSHQIHYDRAKGQVRIETKVQPFMAMMNAMHQTFGMDHGYGWNNFWGFLMLLTTIALLLLSLTGIYLWFKMYKERLVGAVLLLVGLSYGVSLVVLMRM
ncbi:MAG: PepSY-associated TM helix domain-containing protein [Acidobacteriota bacterium]